MSFLVTPVPRARDLVESEVSRESVWATRKIALIDVDGVLRNQRERSLIAPPGENPVSLFKEKLDKAADDDRVKAVVLRINSPGGGVTASDLMYIELQRFKQQTGKPVIASLLDVAASGAYYIACAADQIYAHPTTVTGSIGVIMIAPDFSGTMQKLGVQANIIKSGALKDAGSPFREMTTEDRAVFQQMIDAMYERFLNVVAAARTDIDEPRVRKLADGRVYLAPEAREAGLIDELGTLHDAIRAAKQAAGLGETPVVVVEYARPLAHRPNIYADTTDVPAQVNLVNVDLPDWLHGASPQFMYLWAPGW
jgi:protease-4